MADPILLSQGRSCPQCLWYRHSPGQEQTPASLHFLYDHMCVLHHMYFRDLIALQSTSPGGIQQRITCFLHENNIDSSFPSWRGLSIPQQQLIMVSYTLPHESTDMFQSWKFKNEVSLASSPMPTLESLVSHSRKEGSTVYTAGIVAHNLKMRKELVGFTELEPGLLPSENSLLFCPI